VSLGERHRWDGGFTWEAVWGVHAWVTLGAASMVTERIRLGASVHPDPIEEHHEQPPSRPRPSGAGGVGGGRQTPPAGACARGTTPRAGFVTSDQWKNAPRGLGSASNER
jgi:hypothetical protein